MNFLMRLKLTNFLGSRVVSMENDDGMLEKGVFIPLDMNGLKVSKRNEVCASAFVNELIDRAGWGWTHYIRLKTNREHVELINSSGYQVPFLGNLYHSDYRPKKNYNFSDGRVKNIE